MAVTENKLIKRQDPDKGYGPVIASTRLYQGTLAFWKETGYLDDDTASGINPFAGVVIKDTDNSGGLSGDKTAELWLSGVFELVGSGFAQTDVGLDAFATDNYTVHSSKVSNSVRIGMVVGYVSSTKLLVMIEPTGHITGT